MKKIFILAAASLLAFSSCDNFLDSQDYTGKNSTNFPTTNEDVDKMVAAVYKSCFYGPFEHNNLEQYFSVANIMSDDMFGGAGLGDPWWQALDKLKHEYEESINTLESKQGKLLAQAIEEQNRIIIPSMPFWSIICILGTTVLCGFMCWFKFWKTPDNDETMTYMTVAVIVEVIYYGMMAWNHFTDSEKRKKGKP